jgi:hypothetical protein
MTPLPESDGSPKGGLRIQTAQKPDDQSYQIGTSLTCEKQENARTIARVATITSAPNSPRFLFDFAIELFYKCAD